MRYKFKCQQCEKEFFSNVKLGTSTTDCECGKKAKKVFTSFTGGIIGTFGEYH